MAHRAGSRLHGRGSECLVPLACPAFFQFGDNSLSCGVNFKFVFR